MSAPSQCAMLLPIQCAIMRSMMTGEMEMGRGEAVATF